MTAADLDPQMIDVLRVQEERSLSRVQISQTSVTEIRNLYIQERAYWNADPPAVPRSRNTGSRDQSETLLFVAICRERSRHCRV